MKRHLAPSLFALLLCALPGSVRAAAAQGVDAIVPVAADSVVVRAQPATAQTPTAADVRVEPGDLAPMMRSSAPMFARDVRPAAVPSRDVAAFQGRDWKMPTSRTLMIGGTALALVGLIAVQGDAGAIMALAGGGVAVYGLYLHYNH